MNARITAADQALGKLHGAEDPFVTYIEKVFTDARKECTTSTTEVDVTKYWAHDMATGGVTSCGGYMALWYVDPATNQWKEYGYQSVDMCSDIRSKGVPTSASRTGLQCLTKKGTTVAYPGDAA